MDLFISVLITVILFRIAWKVWKSYQRHYLIHRAVSHEIRQIEKKLKFWEGERERQYELLKTVYNTVLFDLYPKVKISHRKLEKLIHKEINRIVKQPIRLTLFHIYQLLKATLVVILLFSSFFAVEQTIRDFKSFATGTLMNSYKGTLDSEVARKINGVNPKEKEGSAVQSSGTSLKETADDNTQKEVKEPEEPKEQVNSIYQLLPMNLYPDQVSSTEELGEAMAYHMEQLDESFTIQFVGDAATFNQATTDVWEWLDQNQALWISFYEDASLQYIDYGTHFELEVSISYAVTTDELNELYQSVDEILLDMPSGLSDYEKVKYVNDYIVNHTVYELDSDESPYTPYSILLNGEGVCNGYTLATWLLLYALKIENLYVSGNVGEELHAWNLVKLEGEWYHLDTTWNDPVYTGVFKWLGEPTYDYFLISDKKMKKDHEWDYELYPQTALKSYPFTE